MPSKELIITTVAAAALLVPATSLAQEQGTASEQTQQTHYSRSQNRPNAVSEQEQEPCPEQHMGQVAILARQAEYDQDGNVLNPRDTAAAERLAEHYEQRYGESAVSIFFFETNGAPEQTGTTEPGRNQSETYDYGSFYPTMTEVQAEDQRFDITTIAVVGGEKAISTDLVRNIEARVDDPQDPCDEVHTLRRLDGATATETADVVSRHIAGQYEGSTIHYENQQG